MQTETVIDRDENVERVRRSHLADSSLVIWFRRVVLQLYTDSVQKTCFAVHAFNACISENMLRISLKFAARMWMK